MIWRHDTVIAACLAHVHVHALPIMLCMRCWPLSHSGLVFACSLSQANAELRAKLEASLGAPPANGKPESVALTKEQAEMVALF